MSGLSSSSHFQSSDVIHITVMSSSTHMTHSPLCCVPHAKQWHCWPLLFLHKSETFDTSISVSKSFLFSHNSKRLNTHGIWVIPSRKFHFCTFNFSLHSLLIKYNWKSKSKLCNLKTLTACVRAYACMHYAPGDGGNSTRGVGGGLSNVS